MPGMTRPLFPVPVLLVFSLLIPLAVAGPVGGRKVVNMEIEAKTVFTFFAEFKGRERANVIAIGDGRSPLLLFAYDTEGNCIARDIELNGTPDDRTIIWYPPRNQKYKIEVQNTGVVKNTAKIVIR